MKTEFSLFWMNIGRSLRRFTKYLPLVLWEDGSKSISQCNMQDLDK